MKATGRATRKRRDVVKTDYCSYLPKLAADMEITDQRDAERSVFIVGSAAMGRYLLMRGAEDRVMSLIDGARAAGNVCGEFERATDATLKLAALVKFLTKPDEDGILAGERSQSAAAPEPPISELHFRAWDDAQGLRRARDGSRRAVGLLLSAPL